MAAALTCPVCRTDQEFLAWDLCPDCLGLLAEFGSAPGEVVMRDPDDDGRAGGPIPVAVPADEESPRSLGLLLIMAGLLAGRDRGDPLPPPGQLAAQASHYVNAAFAHARRG